MCVLYNYFGVMLKFKYLFVCYIIDVVDLWILLIIYLHYCMLFYYGLIPIRNHRRHYLL